jgi:DNA-binding transcriptional LysR family regulator
MGKAAERLSISQPSISKAIADIEHAIGVRLLDRTSRGVELTSYGSTLVKRGTGAFDELRQGIKDIELLDDPTGGEVRVGCSEEIASGLLLEVLIRFAREYPRVVVNVFPDDYRLEEFYLLRERKVDLCVAVISNSNLDDDLEAEVLYKDRPFIVTGQNNRLVNKRKVELAELIDELWLLSHNHSIGSSLAKAFRAQGLPVPKVRMRSYSVHQRLNLLAKDNFLAAEFGSILRFNADRYPLRVLPVDLQIGSFTTATFTMKNRTYCPVVRTFIDCMRRVAEAIRYPIEKE